jgi:outer membrane protein assembly factor BamB
MHRFGARRSGASLLLLLVLMVGSSSRATAWPIRTGPAPVAPVSWPMFHFDPANTGFNPFETELGPSNVAGLAPAWSHSVKSTRMASPVVDHGVVYVETQGPETWEGTLTALRSEDGNPLWQQTTFSPGGWHCIAAGHGAVYVAALDGPTVSRWLEAFDGTSGVQRWRASGPSRSVAAAGGRVFASMDDGWAFALDPRDGDQIWRAYADIDLPGNLAVAGPLVFAASNDGNAFAFDRSTGALMWEQEAVTSLIGSPAITAGTVFLGTFLGLFALEASSGDILWESQVGEGTDGTPAIANGIVYLLGFDALYAVRARTGDLLWSAPIGDLGIASPSVANGVVYAGSLGGTVHAFHARTGEELWRYDLGVGINTAPVIVDGTLYVAASPFQQGQGELSVVTAFRLPE